MTPACLPLSLALTLTSPSAVSRGPMLYTASVMYAGADSSAATPVPADTMAADSTFAAPLHAPDIPTLRTQPPLIQPIVIGVVSTVAGAAGGGLIGYQLDKGNSYEFLPVGTAVGYLIGETILLPVGVHLGNARHGSFLGDLGISVLGHLGAIGLASLGGGAVYIVGVAGQIAATVANERSSAARRLRAERASAERP